MRAALFLALAGCASYRVLPPPPLEGGVQPIAARYEKSRFLFSSSGEDGAIARVFASGNAAIATVSRPGQGVYASADGGHTWSAAAGPYDFRQVIFAGDRIYARGARAVWHSEDGGKSWAGAEVVPQSDRLDAMALGPGGALYTAGRGQLYVSNDGARSWQLVYLSVPSKPAWRARSIVPDPRHAQVVYLSLRTEPQQELLPRFKALLDFSSDEAVSALKLVDSAEAPPRWGPAEDGVYFTQDGGGLWKRAGLSLDAWLAERDGVLYAIAAEPILQAAALVRRYPDLAGAAERQFKGARADGAALRAALPYPGREALLAGPAAAGLMYRSADGGASWERLQAPSLPVALALRAAAEQGGQDGPHVAPRPEEAPRQKQVPPGAPGRQMGDLAPLPDGSPLQQSRYRGLPRHPRTDQPAAPPPRALTPGTLLAFVDPQRLLARFNGAAPLSGVSGDAAFAAPKQAWDALVDSLVAASIEEGEISLGPAQREGLAFDLLRSGDGGATWMNAVAALPPGSPVSIAGGGPAVYLVRRDGRAWRIAP